MGPVASGGDGASLQSVALSNAKEGVGKAPTVTLSQVFVDYNSDSAYVADDDGFLHKIAPFFTASGAPQETSTPAWQASTSYTVGNLIVDQNGFIEQCTKSGTSGTSQPSWSTTWGANTMDHDVKWDNLGSGGGWPVYITGVSTHTDNVELAGPTQLPLPTLPASSCRTRRDLLTG
jgi:hypothetical protein